MSTRYFILKHVEKSRYKDIKGYLYHYTKDSPNWEKLKEGSKVLIYEKETNLIVGIGEIGKIEKREDGFYAYYSKYEEIKPIPFEHLSKRFKLPDLRRRSPGIIPIKKEIYEFVLRNSK